ncbi:MAG: hypothetical protein K2O18_14180, partial [Oscillospiraceae bacterium]|nr:hypothetical protein [Oscillospiraceae bacterium]
VGGVSSFNGRTGEVKPQSGDYTAAMVGARPDDWVPTAAEVGGVSSFNGRTGEVKPQSGDYTAAMAGADPEGTAAEAVEAHNEDSAAHEDIREALSTKQPLLTGQPGQVVGFDGMGLAYAVRGWSNQNLLINSDFRNPVNRNGQTEYTADGYTIDRWILVTNGGQVSLKIMDGFIRGTKIALPPDGKPTHAISSKRPTPAQFSGKTVTLSVMRRGTGTFQILFLTNIGVIGTKWSPPSEDWTLDFTTVTLPESLTSLTCYIYFDTKASTLGYTDFLAAKLELGSQQTLAHQDEDGNWILNDPPNYDLQYALCSLYSPSTGEWVGYQHSNPNLLDNGYFADPINQRGKTKWTPEPAPETNAEPNTQYSFPGGYTIDRWYLLGGTLTVNGGLRWTSGKVLFQALDGINLADGIQRCISYMDDAGQVYGGPIAASYIRYGDYLFTYSAGQAVYIMSTGSDRKIVATKLELGSVQTLAHQDEDGNWVLNDPPPNKTLELLKCQRYYLPELYANAVHTSENYWAVSAMFPVEMRAVPTFKTTNIAAYPFGNTTVAFSTTVYGITKSGIRYVNDANNDLNTSLNYGVRFTDISAEL